MTLEIETLQYRACKLLCYHYEFKPATQWISIEWVRYLVRMRECAKSWWIMWRRRILENGGQICFLIQQETLLKHISFSVLELRFTQVCSQMHLRRNSKRSCFDSVGNGRPISQRWSKKRRKRLDRGGWWCWGGCWGRCYWWGGGG